MLVADDGPGAGVVVVVGGVGGVVVAPSPLDLWKSATHVSILDRCADSHALFSATISPARTIVLFSIAVMSWAAVSTLLN